MADWLASRWNTDQEGNAGYPTLSWESSDVIISSDSYVSNLDLEKARITIRDGATLYVDEQFKPWKIQIGADGTAGYLNFQSITDIEFSDPIIWFYDYDGRNTEGLILSQGAIEVDTTFGEMVENDYRYILRAYYNQFNIFTDSYFEPSKFSLKDTEHIEMFDVNNSLSFMDADGTMRDLDLGPLSDYSPSVDINIKTSTVEGGSSVWSKFKHSKGKTFGVTGRIPRLEDDVYLERLERIANDKQRYAPLLLVSENYTGYCRILNVEYDVSSPRIADYGMELQRVKEAYE